jgi:hypothetical protein
MNTFFATYFNSAQFIHFTLLSALIVQFATGCWDDNGTTSHAATGGDVRVTSGRGEASGTSEVSTADSVTSGERDLWPR